MERGILSKLSAWPTREERRVLGRQLAVIFVVISLLNLFGIWQRALIHAEVQTNLRRLVYGWDGWVWYVWLLAAPATLLLIRRCKWQPGQIGRDLAATAVGSAGIYLAVSNLRYALRILPNVWLPDSLDLPVNWAIYFHTQMVLLPIDFITYSGLFAVSFSFDQFFKSRQRTEEVHRLQLSEARLQAELARAQWSTLVRQIQPHFLFNALNAVSSLVRQRKNEDAVLMIAELSELLRLSMERIDEPELSLRRELAFVRHYLAVERVRFGAKLRFELDAADETMEGRVPNLLLQPLVENAVNHGIARRTSSGCVRVHARREGPRLRISVSDDGPGFAADGGRTDGIGLANTRGRLQNLYGGDYDLRIESAPQGGTTVMIDLPWRSES